MTTLKTALLATMLAGAVGATALTPAAFAQSTPNTTATAPTTQPAAAPARGPGGGMPRLSCDADGATQLQSRLDQLGTNLALTAEQQTLFDAYRTATLTAQTSFADACSKVQPPAQGTAPDLLAGLKARQAMATAQLAALNATLPSFEALYNSLTDTQKQSLIPAGPRGPGGPNGKAGHNRRGFGPGEHGKQGGQDRHGPGGKRGPGGPQGGPGDGGPMGGFGFGFGFGFGPGFGFEPGMNPPPPPPAPAQPEAAPQSDAPAAPATIEPAPAAPANAG